MSNVTELSGDATKQSVLPTVGTNKIWYRGAEAGVNPNYDDVRNMGFTTYITTESPTYIDNHSIQMKADYGKQFTSLINEAQQSSEITNLLTTDVTNEIYNKMSELMYNVYNMASVIHESFANTQFKNGLYNTGTLYNDPIPLTNSITSTYKENFSKNESINVFEIETPSSIRAPYNIFLSYSLSPIPDNGLNSKAVLFSSADLNIVEADPNEVVKRQLGGKPLYTLSKPDNNQKNYIVKGKPWVEYARDFGIEVATHSKVLSSPKIASIRKDNKHTSSGFMITRDKEETITGLIFYYALIVPRPYIKNELTIVTSNLYDRLTGTIQRLANETRAYKSLVDYYEYQIAIYNQIDGYIKETDTINRKAELLSARINDNTYQETRTLFNTNGTTGKTFKEQLLVDVASYLNQATSTWITSNNLTSLQNKLSENTKLYTDTKASLDTNGKNNQFLDMYTRYKLDLDLYNSSEKKYNTNNRESYIAISSSINIFDLSEYYSIRTNIVSSNLVTLLIYTNNTINDVDGYEFKAGDTEFEFGHPSEYENLKCIVSTTNTSWSGKKISECTIPYTTIDYPEYIYNIISSINKSVSRNAIIDNQKLMFCKQLGNNKLIIIINIRIIKSTGKISFQMKEIQYNNLFPAKIINADTEISGELIVKKTTGEELMKIDPITKLTTFFTKVGINQPEYDINGLLDIDNLTYTQVKSFVNDLKKIIFKSNTISNDIQTSNLSNDSINQIKDNTTNETLCSIPLKQYKSKTTKIILVDRANRMNQLTAKVEEPMVVLAIQRTLVRIAEIDYKIETNFGLIGELNKELAYQKTVEILIEIGMFLVEILAVVVIIASGGAATPLVAVSVEILTEMVKYIIQNIDWSDIALNECNILKEYSDNIPEEKDTAVKALEYLIACVYKRISILQDERVAEEQTKSELEARLAEYRELNSANATRYNNINTNNTMAQTLTNDIRGLEQQLEILKKIEANVHTVVDNVYGANNRVLSYTRSLEPGIILGVKSNGIIKREDVSNYTLLTNSTTMTDFSNNYITDPSFNTISEKNTLNSLYTYANTTQTTQTSSNTNIKYTSTITSKGTVYKVNLATTSILAYITNVYIPYIITEIGKKTTELNNLNNKVKQIAFTSVAIDTSKLTAINKEIDELKIKINNEEFERDYWSGRKNFAYGITGSGMGDHRWLDQQWGWLGYDYSPSGKFWNKAYSFEGGFKVYSSTDGRRNREVPGYDVKAQAWARATVANGYDRENTITTAVANISSYKNKLRNLEEQKMDAIEDELQQVTKLYSLTNESHNKLRDIINNIWQMYADPLYNEVAKDENYTVFTNLVDNEKSSTYALNMNILYRNDNKNPIIVITNSMLDTSSYSVDLSYRRKFDEIMVQISGASELLNYVTIIFKSNILNITKNKTTIEEQIANDDLFISRFNTNSYITIDNLTDNIVVADEENPQWNGQSFNNIIIPNTDTTLESVYETMNTTFINDYGSITYDRNYIIDYKVDNLSTICVVRYIKLITKLKDESKIKTTVYRIYCKIDLNSLVDKAMNISGDSTFYGDFNVKPNSNVDSMFQVDTFNKNIINMSKVGIGTVNPHAMLDIKDTTMTDVIRMDSVIEQQIYTMKKMIDRIANGKYTKLVNSITTEATGYTLTDDYFYCYKLPDISGGKMNAENITVLYHGRNMNWNNLTYAEIIKRFPGFANQIINDILPENQHNLDNYLLYDGAMYTTSHAFDNGTKRSHHMVFRWRGKLCVLGTGFNIERYNIQENMNTKKTDDMIEYTDKQLKFMNYVKNKNNKRDRIVDLSGTEVEIHNKNKASSELALSFNSLPSLSDNIEIYYVDSSNASILDVYVDDISNVRTYVSNETKNIFDKYTMIPGIDKTYIRNKVYDIPLKKGKEKHVSFLNTLNSKYNNNLNNLKHNHIGFIIYNDEHDYYRSIYYINKKTSNAGATSYQMHIYSFHMKYNDYIGNTLNIHGDVLMEGGLSLVNTYNNKPHVTINPFNKYVGVNTSERFINYADLYTTTASIYNTPHNLIVSNDKYPNAVFDRIQESKALVTSGDYTYFGSYSGATIRRTSNLFLYDASFMNFVGLNNRISGNSNVPSLMSGDNWSTYKHYGPDVSFEVKDCSGITTELGQLKMVVDKIDTNGNIQAGFGVQVVDANMGGNSIDKNMKNLMYVNNDKRLFINDIVLGKKLLTVDTSYNLVWNNKTILVEDSAIVTSLVAHDLILDGSVNTLEAHDLILDTSVNALKAHDLILDISVNALETNKANLSGANFNGNVSIAGNFTVSGTTTTLSTTNLDISDSIIGLSRGAPAGFVYDAGIVFNRGTDASNQAFGFINQNKKFTLGSTDTSGGSINLNITPGTLIANLEGNVYGNVYNATLTGPTIERLDSSMARITSVGSRLDNSMVDLTDLVSTLDGSMARITGLVSTLDISMARITAVGSRLDSSMVDLTAVGSRLDISVNALEAHDLILDSSMARITGLVSTLDSSMARITGLVSTLDSSMARITAVGSRLDNSMVDLTALVSTLDSSMVDLTALVSTLDGSMALITAVGSRLDNSMNDLTSVVSTLDNSMNDLTDRCTILDSSMAVVQSMLSKKLDIFTNISTTSSLPQVGSYIIDTSNITLTLLTPQTPGQLITLYSGLTGGNTYILNNGDTIAKTSTISSGTVTLCISTGTSAGNWVAYSSGVLVTFV
jgi:hypothetical protein